MRDGGWEHAMAKRVRTCLVPSFLSLFIDFSWQGYSPVIMWKCWSKHTIKNFSSSYNVKPDFCARNGK